MLAKLTEATGHAACCCAHKLFALGVFSNLNVFDFEKKRKPQNIEATQQKITAESWPTQEAQRKKNISTNENTSDIT